MRKFNKRNIPIILIITLSQIHILFRGIDLRVDWFLLVDKTRNITFNVFMICCLLKFIVMHYYVLYPKGIHRGLIRFIFILSILDLVHYFMTAGYGLFGLAKMFLAMLITILYQKYKYKYKYK